MYSTTLINLALCLYPFLSSAHFQLLSPPARGYDEDTLATYPCGGQDKVSSNRSMFPLAGGPVQLNMEHDHADVQVNIAMGSDTTDGNSFNMSLVPILQEEGIGKFCLGDVMIPAGMNVKDGMNATIQVITNGDPQGGLYNVSRWPFLLDVWSSHYGLSVGVFGGDTDRYPQCADITFSSSAQPGTCTNGTGVKAVSYTGSNKNANGSDSSPATTSASGATASPTGTSGGGRAESIGLGLLSVLAGAMAVAVGL